MNNSKQRLFLQALKNNTTFIGEWLAQNPNMIDMQWDWDDYQYVDGYITPMRVAVAAVVIAPIAPIISLFLCGLHLYSIDHRPTYDKLWWGDRNKWTMLEFAIESGAFDVARILILNGATITPRCHKLLAPHMLKNKAFFDSCTSLIDLQTQNVMLRNQLDEAKIREQQLKLISSEPHAQHVNEIPLESKAELIRIKDQLQHKIERNNYYKNNSVILFTILKDNNLIPPQESASPQP